MYEVEVLKERRFSSTLDPKRLADVLNSRASDGWTFVRSITSTSRSWLLFSRETHFLVFERR